MTVVTPRQRRRKLSEQLQEKKPDDAKQGTNGKAHEAAEEKWAVIVGRELEKSVRLVSKPIVSRRPAIKPQFFEPHLPQLAQNDHSSKEHPEDEKSETRYGRLKLSPIIAQQRANERERCHASTRIRKNQESYARLQPLMEMATLLLENGADAEATNEVGETPIYASVQHPATFEILYAHGANIDARRRRGYTPLHVAVLSGDVAAVELLLRHWADVRIRGGFDDETALDIAIKAWTGREHCAL